MKNPELPNATGDEVASALQPVDSLTKRDYFAVHLFDAVTSKLSLNCSLQDKAQYAVDAADALMEALAQKPS